MIFIKKVREVPLDFVPHAFNQNHARRTGDLPGYYFDGPQEGETNGTFHVFHIKVTRPLAETGSAVGIGSPPPPAGGSDILAGAQGSRTRYRQVIRTDSRQFAVGRSFQLAEGEGCVLTEIYPKSKTNEDFDAYSGWASRISPPADRITSY